MASGEIPASSTLDERSDLGTGDAALYAFWVGQEAIAEKEERPWIKKARKIVKRYRDDRGEKPGDGSGGVHRYNILWSNVQTLRPTLYARTPKPDVERRFKDQDDVGRLASTLLERSLVYSTDCTDFDTVMSSCVEDKLLPGRGVGRVMYVPTYGEPLSAEESNAEFEQEDDAAAIVDTAGDTRSAQQGQQNIPQQPQIEPLREVVYEEVLLKYIFWEDYREGPARKWVEVPWVRYRAYMTLDELTTRFGKAKAKLVTLDYTPKGTPEDRKDETPPDMFKKAIVHEYWDKTKKQVVWLPPGTPDLILDKQDDPLGLRDFFPNPDPLLATTTNDRRIPVPDYVEYQDQAIELDTLTGRIDRLTRALKVSGIYPGENKQVLQQLVDSGTENMLIPVEDWLKWSDNGGLKEFIQWMPIDQVAQTLIQLYEARDKTKNDLYEITGIGDIMRGNTSPIETLGAQQLKANFITRRVVPQQREVARFARDCFRLMANVIAEHFSPKTISLMTGYPQLQPVPQVPPPPPQFLAPQMPQQGVPPQLSVVPPQGAPQQPQLGHALGQPPPQQGPPPAQPNPAYAQWQQMAQKAQTVQQANQKLQQQFDAAVALIKQDGVYGFRIDIEADSTIAPDEQAEKASRTEFLKEFVPFMEQLVPIAQGNQTMAELAKQFALFAVRGFRVARPLEESVEAAFDALAQMPPHPTQQPKQSTSNVDSPADLALRAHETDAKTQIAQQSNAIKAEQVQNQAVEAAERLRIEEQENHRNAGLESAKAVDEAIFRRERASAMDARSAKALI
jgi:hypothetical protein